MKKLFRNLSLLAKLGMCVILDGDYHKVVGLVVLLTEFSSNSNYKFRYLFWNKMIENPKLYYYFFNNGRLFK